MEDNKYSQMQKDFYEKEAQEWSSENRNPVVGSFDAHNDWKDYEYLFEGLDTKEMIALDFGCGPGRNIVKYWNDFYLIDGADISPTLLEKARIYIDESVEHKRVFYDLYECNGYDLHDIDDETYDIIFSTIVLQHICVWTIRYNYFKEFFRVLVPGGWFTAQMGAGENSPQAVPYYYNFYNATGTNRAMDTMVENPEYLQFDLERIGFVDFSYKFGPTGPGDVHPAWIYFKARKPL